MLVDSKMVENAKAEHAALILGGRSSLFVRW